MKVGQPVLRILTVFLLFLVGHKAHAQPTLPDLAGTADNGVVTLSWMCQYSAVKSIAVLRSADSTKITKNIGYVKNLEKGAQTFTDAHPEAGRNFYKLTILFKSGLSWSSNRVGVFSVMEPKVKVTEKFSGTEQAESSKSAMEDKDGLDSAVNAPRQVGRDTTQRPKITISYDIDSNTVDTTARSVVVPPKKKIIITFDDQGNIGSASIRYRFISVDALTGHIDMNLPDDVGAHHYSVKFYDDKDRIVTEIPRITRANIIIEKRNFQRKGIYKFVIRRDVVELESGYITIH